MGMIEMALQAAGTQSDRIAKILGRNPQEVKSAIEQGKKMLPQLMSNPNDGIGVLRNLGVDKNFVNSMYNKYGRYAGKLGINDEYLRKTIGSINNSLQGANTDVKTNTNSKSNIGFDGSRYPKV